MIHLGTVCYKKRVVRTPAVPKIIIIFIKKGEGILPLLINPFFPFLDNLPMSLFPPFQLIKIE